MRLWKMGAQLISQKTIYRSDGDVMKEYALYKGEDILAIGTLEEIAASLGVAVETVKFYGMPSYLKRIKGQNARELIELEEE